MLHSEIVVAQFRILACAEGLPELYDSYRQHATLLDEIELSSADGKVCFFAVADQNGWPKLVIAQRYSPSGYGFYPGLLVVPETAVLFIGAGERIIAYRMDTAPVRLWTDHADTGFSSWSRFGKFVVMAAELEFAAWTIEGKKLWSTFVEPPWDYTVTDGRVHLDVMGNRSSFDIASGPRAG